MGRTGWDLGMSELDSDIRRNLRGKFTWTHRMLDTRPLYGASAHGADNEAITGQGGTIAPGPARSETGRALPDLTETPQPDAVGKAGCRAAKPDARCSQKSRRVHPFGGCVGGLDLDTKSKTHLCQRSTRKLKWLHLTL